MLSALTKAAIIFVIGHIAFVTLAITLSGAN
jgi:hypothetical protein